MLLQQESVNGEINGLVPEMGHHKWITQQLRWGYGSLLEPETFRIVKHLKLLRHKTHVLNSDMLFLVEVF